MEHVAEMMGEPTRPVERQLVELLGYATIRSKAKDLFLSLPQAMTKYASGQKNMSTEDVAMLKYLHRLLRDAFQRVTLKVLCRGLLNSVCRILFFFFEGFKN